MTMPLSQLIYSSTAVETMTPRLSHELSKHSVTVCKQLGLTGRVFANDWRAFAITEGDSALVKQYFEAVKSNALIDSIVLNVERRIDAREFADYSVWLNSKEHYDCGVHVKRLCPQSLREALPAKPSAKIRIMIDAFLKPDIFAA